jgi:hypothetical protein
MSIDDLLLFEKIEELKFLENQKKEDSFSLTDKVKATIEQQISIFNFIINKISIFADNIEITSSLKEISDFIDVKYKKVGEKNFKILIKKCERLIISLKTKREYNRLVSEREEIEFDFFKFIHLILNTVHMQLKKIENFFNQEKKNIKLYREILYYIFKGYSILFRDGIQMIHSDDTITEELTTAIVKTLYPNQSLTNTILKNIKKPSKSFERILFKVNDFNTFFKIFPNDYIKEDYLRRKIVEDYNIIFGFLGEKMFDTRIYIGLDRIKKVLPLLSNFNDNILKFYDKKNPGEVSEESVHKQLKEELWNKLLEELQSSLNKKNQEKENKEDNTNV